MGFKATKLRLVLSSLLAVLALGAVTASAAQAATEGPFYKIAGKRLASGETKEVTAKGTFSVTEGGGGRIECKKTALAAGSKLLGSTGANFGSADVTLDFSECSVPHELFNHSGCSHLAGGKLTTEPLNMELTYFKETRTGGLMVVFKPVKKPYFAKYQFEEKGCTEGTIGGSMVAEITTGGKGVEVGQEPAAAKTLHLHWGGFNGGKVWLEQAGILKELEPGLEGPLGESTANTELELEVGGTTWGVFT
jgi:hypothetical protein